MFLLTLLQAKIHDNYEDIAKQLEIHLQQQVENISKEHSEFKESLNLINELVERYNSNKPPSYI